MGGFSGIGSLGAALLDIRHLIDDVEQNQQNAGGEEHLVEKVFQCPEEGNALQVTEEKGRVAKRRKAAADIGHHEDEEDNLMSSVFSVGVGSEKRPDK